MRRARACVASWRTSPKEWWMGRRGGRRDPSIITPAAPEGNLTARPLLLHLVLRPRRLRRRVALQLLHAVLDAALELRVVAGDQRVRRVLDLDVGIDAVVLDHPLAALGIPHAEV